jgi:DNA-directed RNA polymerase specialized sigma24 family protein
MATTVSRDDGSRDTASAGGPSWNELMTALTVQQRAVATLFYAEDQSIDTIAAALDISTGTVKSTLAKVRSNVRRALSGTNEMRPRP